MVRQNPCLNRKEEEVALVEARHIGQLAGADALSEQGYVHGGTWHGRGGGHRRVVW